ncbi:hypothetical protein [Rhizobium sp. AG855]|uniref:hypothetical protein n=1 Tax=Rhizobium sp. AG855 TaxID=2183898 RepID=UPI000E738355|nr:hypothetical protein [Rhizobium sp. AG855]RKE75889.1 hypothetical protein DFO46_4775 [Rhizobium sp. AG855]
MTEEELRVVWDAMSSVVADRMKVYTRSFVAILAGDSKVGTGTFIKQEEVRLLTCEHVARFYPVAYHVDDRGTTNIQPLIWCVEPDESKDVAMASIPAVEWESSITTVRPLPIAKFAPSHRPVENELLFFRGIAGENVGYIGNFGSDVILTGYCSQEKRGTSDKDIFEILWSPKNSTISRGTSETARERLKHDDPAGFSGSLVWNTRFVELGCNISRWSPDDAVVTGLLRRYDDDTDTLLAWRAEHMHAWLQSQRCTNQDLCNTPPLP